MDQLTDWLTDRQTDRQKERKKERKKGREGERKEERKKERKKERKRDQQTPITYTIKIMLPTLRDELPVPLGLGAPWHIPGHAHFEEMVAFCRKRINAKVTK